ncbi:MAG TPA: NAD(P)/FAD-dependent oxidoreductase, partial [Clostridiaceae bacterium]|nr:NAD(P)/FAD-dependent oxidoreductase [Clostridiaceae bacterium]
KVILDSKNNSYKKFYFKGNKLVGYLLVNDVDRAGIYTDLIRNETDISGFKDNFSRDGLGLISFPREMRKERMLS